MCRRGDTTAESDSGPSAKPNRGGLIYERAHRPAENTPLADGSAIFFALFG